MFLSVIPSHFMTFQATSRARQYVGVRAISCHVRAFIGTRSLPPAHSRPFPAMVHPFTATASPHQSRPRKFPKSHDLSHHPTPLKCGQKWPCPACFRNFRNLLNPAQSSQVGSYRGKRSHRRSFLPRLRDEETHGPGVASCHLVQIMGNSSDGAPARHHAKVEKTANFTFVP